MRYIDADAIIRETDGGKDIFKHYYPGYEYGNRKAMLKLRAEEKTASAQITNYKGEWRVTDFGNQTDVNSLDGIRFVMWRESLSWYEALKFIEDVILRHEIDAGQWKKPQLRADYSFREMGPDDKKGEYNFVYKTKSEITRKDLEAIGRYVTADLLEEYCCRVLKYYEFCSFSEKQKKDVVHKFTATDDFPMFVFDYGGFKKIYKPHEPEKKHRFHYVGDKPKTYIYGLRQLRETHNEFASLDDEESDTPADKPKAIVRDLFRCSGESDALNLASLGFRVYWLNSETAELTWDEYKEVDELCEYHYQIMDLDYTGRQMALKNGLKYIDMLTLELPTFLGAKKDFRGNPCKDLKDFVNLVGDSQEQTRSEFVSLKPKARKVKFWGKDDKGNYYVNMTYFHFFLKANGFYQMEYSRMKNSDYCYAWVRGKVVDLIAPDSIKRIVKRFTHEWICRKKFPDEVAILNKLITSNQISEGYLDMMESIEVNFKNVTSQFEYLHFQNGSLRISRDKIERIRHEDVPNYILGSIRIKDKDISHVIKHNITASGEAPAIEVNPSAAYAELLRRRTEAKTEEERQQVASEIKLFSDTDRYEVKINDRDFIFTTFLRDLSRIHWRKELEAGEQLTEQERKEEMLALINIMFCMGYLAAQYKNQGKPWIVFIQDMKISQVGQSSGRSGKSLVSQALKFVRQHFYVEGRRLDDKNAFQFIYDGLTEFHDVIEVDDLAEFGDFSFFYTQTTGQRTVNSKHTSPFVLDYEDSGKMIISSNFELPNTDSSTMARLLNCGVGDYYHEQSNFNDYLENRSPLSKFGRQMYIDFSDEEWAKFFHFMAYCIQMAMRFDKIQPPMGNIEKRQLRRLMSDGLGREENFMKWADDYFQVWDSTEVPRPQKTPDGADCAYLNTMFLRQAALDHFLENSGISESRKKSFNAQTFKARVDYWARYHEFELNPVEMCRSEKDRRIIGKHEGKTREYFYVRTAAGQALPDPDIDPLVEECMPF